MSPRAHRMRRAFSPLSSRATRATRASSCAGIAKVAAKKRGRLAVGIVEESAVTLHNDDEVFSFSAAAKMGGVDALGEDRGDVNDEDAEDAEAAEEVIARREVKFVEYSDELARGVAIEDQLDDAYNAFAARRAGKAGAPRAEKHKLKKKTRDAIASALVADDIAQWDGDVSEYVKALAPKDAHSDSDDESDDEKLEKEAAATPAELGEREAAAVARWFSNPIFGANDEDEDDDSDDGVPLVMPKSDKVMRKEKRKIVKDRNERRAKKRKGELDENDVLVVAPNTSKAGGAKPANANPKIAARELRAVEHSDAAKKQIKAGLGKLSTRGGGEDAALEIVPGPAQEDEADPFAAPMRTYDSDEDEDDVDSKATNLALATMMMRKSKAKELVDASYNRFAWHDPKDLPAWFVDDEKRHYRPQLPIKPELLAEMKLRFQQLAAKPIKRVVEARARKKTRAEARLKQAKRKAEAVANDPHMTPSRKLKEVAKAMGKGGAKDKRPDKKYVVTKKTKTGANKTQAKNKTLTKGSRVINVDARMKKDKKLDKLRAKKGPKKRK